MKGPLLKNQGKVAVKKSKTELSSAPLLSLRWHGTPEEPGVSWAVDTHGNTPSQCGMEWLLKGLRDMESLIKFLILVLLCSSCSTALTPLSRSPGPLPKSPHTQTSVLESAFAGGGAVVEALRLRQTPHPTSSKQFCLCF